MNIQQRATVDRFSRVLVFLEGDHPVLDGASSGFGTQVQQLQNAVATIEQAASDRGSGRGATRIQRLAKRRCLGGIRSSSHEDERDEKQAGW